MAMQILLNPIETKMKDERRETMVMQTKMEDKKMTKAVMMCVVNEA